MTSTPVPQPAPDRLFFVLACVLALTAVALGAFGAHGLESRVSGERLEVFETAARYQMYHALALFAVAWAHSRWPGRAAKLAGWLFIAGIVLFSGSLYMLVLLDRPQLGAITPLGGVAFMAGWLSLALSTRSR